MTDAVLSPVLNQATEVVETGHATPRASGLIRLIADPSSRVPTYIGIATTAVGFALIGITWARVAALLNVALQMPYVVSGGFTGLALVMVGLIVINIAAKRQDLAERARQFDRLTSVLADLRHILEDQAEDEG